MSIFLKVLSVLGIILLVILAIVLIILLIVLFVPIRYRAHVLYDAEHLEAEGGGSWILKLIRVLASYKKGEGLSYSVKVAFLQILPKKEKKKEEEYEPAHVIEIGEDEDEEPEEAEAGAETRPEPAPETESRPSEEPVTEPEKEEQKPEPAEESAPEPPRESRTGSDEPPEEDELGLVLRLIRDVSMKAMDIEDAVDVFFDKIEEKYSETSKKVRVLLVKKDLIVEFLTAEGTMSGIELTLKRLFRILGRYLPELSGKVRYGTGDPYSLGGQLMYVSLFYSIYSDSVEITPEWDEKVLEADVGADGKIRLCHVAGLALAVLFGPKCRKLRKNFKRLRKRLKAVDTKVNHKKNRKDQDNG